MRDPERIQRILMKLELLWEANPQLRLCQLIVNMTSADPFYVDDVQLEAELDKELAKLSPDGPMDKAIPS